MSRCERSVEAARFEFLSQEQRASFTQHAAKCDACTGAFGLLHDARTTLRANLREPDDDQLRALRLGVEAKTSRRARAWFAVPVAAAACAAVFMLWPNSPVIEGRVLHAGVAVTDTLPVYAELHAEAGTALTHADATLRAPTPATFAVDASEVRLSSGTMQFDVTHALWVSTPHTRVRAADARFAVEVLSGRTALRVEAGIVEASDGEATVRVAAGDAVRIPREVVATKQTVEPMRAPAVEADEAVEAAEAVAPERSPKRRAVRAPRPKLEPKPKARPEPVPRPVAEPERSEPDVAPRTPPIPKPEPALAPAPRPERTPEAWMALGDARRRAKDHAAAAEAYAKAGAAPELAEEASWRRAEMLGAAGEVDAALAQLESSQRRFGAGRLGPERAALAAQLAVDSGRYEAAARALEAAPTSSFVVRSARLAIGGRLVAEDAALARRVVAPLLGPGHPRSIRMRAYVVAIRAAHEARDVDDESALRAALEKIQAGE